MSFDTPPPPPPSFDGGAPNGNVNDRNLAVIAHLGTLANFIVGVGWLVPLVLMLTKGAQSPLVRRNAVESLNFQITMIISAVIGGVLILVLVGIFVLIAVGIASFVLPIVAAVKVSNGEEYRYPFTFRFVS